MKEKSIFERYEFKYLITSQQKQKLMTLFNDYMQADKFGHGTIYNLYYDTEDFILARRSIEKPVYKEKLRVRSYGVAENDSKVFLELKKKYKKVVYKRRILLTQQQAVDYFKGEYTLPNTQIAKEIGYFKEIYKGIEPKAFIAYDREAYFHKERDDFRVTFDENILWRDFDLSLCSPKYGNELLPKGLSLMEIKVSCGMPLWMVHFLTENNIYKTVFSKYGNAYKEICTKKGVRIDAA